MYFGSSRQFPAELYPHIRFLRIYQQRFGKKFDGPLSGKEIRDHGLPLAAVTCAEVFQKHDYATGMFGKWHLGYIPPWLPPSQGFAEFRGLGSGDGDHHTHINRWGYEDWWHNNELDKTDGYTADLITQYSIEFIENHQREPFFLYVPHLAIHFPWQGPDDPPQRKQGSGCKVVCRKSHGHERNEKYRAWR